MNLLEREEPLPKIIQWFQGLYLVTAKRVKGQYVIISCEIPKKEKRDESL